MLDDIAARIVAHSVAVRTQTEVPDLSLIAADRKIEPTDLVYEPMICFVVAGTKRVDFGARSQLASRGEMMLNSTIVPAVATFEEVPYLSVIMTLDPATLTTLMVEMNTPADDQASTASPGQLTAPMSADLIDAVGRWVRLLDDPDDIAVLGPRIEAEIVYRLLTSPLGSELRQFAAADSAAARIRTVASWMCEHYDEALRVDELAQMALMSPATFHRWFRTATGQSPMRFHRQIRLQHARRLLARGDSAAQAAAAVGYSSPNQFSREYRDFYGAPPRRDVDRLLASGVSPNVLLTRQTN